MGSIESYPTSSGRRYRVRYRKPDRSQTDKRGFRTNRDAELFLASVEAFSRIEGRVKGATPLHREATRSALDIVPQCAILRDRGGREEPGVILPRSDGPSLISILRAVSPLQAQRVSEGR